MTSYDVMSSSPKQSVPSSFGSSSSPKYHLGLVILQFQRLGRTKILRCLSNMATIHIQSGKSSYSRKNSKIHNIPCKILADCDANVDKFFDSYVKAKDDETLKASFRGYPLQGRKIKVPDGYLGITLHESVKPETEKDERKFYIINQFSEMTFWNWDRKPSKNDLVSQALEWIDIAEVLHEPILEE